MRNWDLWKTENLENSQNVIIPLVQILAVYWYSSHKPFIESPEWEQLLRVLCQTMDSLNLIVSLNQDGNSYFTAQESNGGEKQGKECICYPSHHPVATSCSPRNATTSQDAISSKSIVWIPNRVCHPQLELYF